MYILVLNCGSSSVKAAVIQPLSGKTALSVDIERIPQAPIIRFPGEPEIRLEQVGHSYALDQLFPLILDRLEGQPLAGIGHRVAHGGSLFDRATRITDQVMEQIHQLSELAPLHNPPNLKGIQIARKLFPTLPQVAVFDTAFHHTLPSRSKQYALPNDLTKKYNLRRYGFHGTSHEYVAQQAAEYLEADLRDLCLISCHLGSGCSVAAIEYGRSVETSMGMTPLEGLVMNTRSGDLDPGILTFLQEKEGLSAKELEEMLNRKSGLLGLSGESGDMRDILEKAGEGHEESRQAIQIFTHRIRKYIGAYAAVMGKLDGIIFTAGIGENSAVIRKRVCERMEVLGVHLDPDKNREIDLSEAAPVGNFSDDRSRVQLLAIKTDEQLAIARKTANLILEKDRVNSIPEIPVAISARHVHLKQETLEQLYGPGYELTIKKWLSQPGQFAANETVTLVGPKNNLEHVRILGPCRDIDQVEISRTDEFFLGIDAPIRESGKIQNTPGIKLIGPAGSVQLKEGLICAWRHIHMTPEDAEIFGVEDRDVVDVHIGGSNRDLTFGNVLIRVSPKYKLEMHIDTDEGNAAEIRPGDTGALGTTGLSGTLSQRRVSRKS